MRIRKRRGWYQVVKHGNILLVSPTKSGAEAFIAVRKETRREKQV